MPVPAYIAATAARAANGALSLMESLAGRLRPTVRGAWAPTETPATQPPAPDSLRRATPPSLWSAIVGPHGDGITAAGWAAEAAAMTRACIEIALADRYTRGELAGLRWEFRAGRDTPEAHRNAMHLNVNFGLQNPKDPTAPMGRVCRHAWSTYIERIARAAGCGWRSQVVEFDWERVEHGGARRSIYWVRDLVDLPPEHHECFVWEEGQLAGERNGWTGSGAIYPASHLLVFTLGQEGRNLYGDGGMLYPARDDAKLKRLYWKLLAVGGEKWALFTPIIKIDRRLAHELGYTPEEVRAMIEDGFAALERYVAGDSSVLACNPAVAYDTFGNPNFDPAKLLAIYEAAASKMLRAFLLNLLGMGSTEVGNRSVGDHLRSAHETMLISIADMIAETLSGPPRPGAASIMRVLDWTWGRQHPLDYPVLHHIGVREDPAADVMPYAPHYAGVNMGQTHPALMAGLLRIAGIDPDTPTDQAIAQLAATRPHTPSLDPADGGVPATPPMTDDASAPGAAA